MNVNELFKVTNVSNKMCYVVTYSDGQYEDFRVRIVGIFLDASEAEKLKTEIENKIKAIKDIPCPFKDDDLDSLTDDELDIYYKWNDERSDAFDFNFVEVTEYPLFK